mgnify:FL=1
MPCVRLTDVYVVLACSEIYSISFGKENAERNLEECMRKFPECWMRTVRIPWVD